MALDLGVLSKSKNKKTEGISFKKALLMSIFVVCLSMVFYSILLGFGHQLHGIDSIEKLETIVHKHRHPIKII
ncbi:TerC family protein, partial [Escherichia coli]|nr:TerC family protein [Escherichia coli]